MLFIVKPSPIGKKMVLGLHSMSILRYIQITGNLTLNASGGRHGIVRKHYYKDLGVN